MRLLLDMNMPAEFAGQLQTIGHDAVHALDAGFGGRPDADIFEHAARENRIVVTFDLDFGEIAAVARYPGPGVILLRLRSIRRSRLWERLVVGIAQATAPLEAGAIVLVEDARIRVRRMPIEE